MPIYFASVRSRRQALLRVTNEWRLVAPSEFRRGQKARYALLEVVSCCEPRHFPLPRSGLAISRAMAMVRHWLPFARSGNDRSGAHRNRCGRSSAGHPSTWLNGVALCITAKLAANVRVRSNPDFLLGGGRTSASAECKTLVRECSPLVNLRNSA